MKKPKPPYNEKSAIRAALRGAWSMHPVLQEVLKRERVEVKRILKSGAVSAKPNVRFRCHICGELFARKDVRLDHVDPVGPTPGSRLAPPDLDWNKFIARLFCSADNIKPVCEPCHHGKSVAEKDKLREEKKSA